MSTKEGTSTHKGCEKANHIRTTTDRCATTSDTARDAVPSLPGPSQSSGASLGVPTRPQACPQCKDQALRAT